MSDTENTGTDSPAESPNTAGETAGGMTVEELRDWLREWVATTTGLPVEQISVDRPMEEFGLAARDAVALAADVEDRTGVILTATAAYNHPTIAMLAKRIIEGDPDEGLDVDADRFEIDDLRRCIDPHPHIRVSLAEPRQSGDQPFRGKDRRYRDREHEAV